jgi:tetratricopeptide (TPR) repeat protein
MMAMETAQGKLVIAPFGADTYGDDVLLFEHGILFGLEMAIEAAGGWTFADVHDQLGGADKRERVLEALTESEVRTLAAKAKCDAFIDGMLLCTRDEETDALAEIAVALRVFKPATGEFEIPDALVFRSFSTADEGDRSGTSLALDYDHYIALQYRVCEEVFNALGSELPRHFTADTLQITPNWEAYALFIKGKRSTNIPETKLGYYEQAIKKDPSFFLALYNSAMLYKTQTDYNTARTRLMKAAASTHDSALLADIYFELGLTSIYLGDPKTARNFWEKALEFGGDNPSLLVNMAGTYEQEENWNEAKHLNQLVVDQFPDYHKAVVNLARLHAMFGQLDLAIPLYERALELQPNDALRHSVLGGCYLADGRVDDARREFERAVELDPDGDPGKYAAQELAKLKPPTNEESGDDDTKKRKRWGLW